MTYADGNGLVYGAAAKFLLSKHISGKGYERDFPTAPGVVGTGCKVFGFRHQVLALSMLYVNTTEALIDAAWDADLATIGQLPVTVVISGVTYQACTIEGESCKLMQARPAGAGYVKSEAALILTRRRLS